MKKVKLHLVSNKAMKQIYNIVTIYLCDDTAHTFDLKEWDVYRDVDCVEFHKLDDTAVEIFYSNNVMRISFTGNKIIKEGPVLKPVA